MNETLLSKCITLRNSILDCSLFVGLSKSNVLINTSDEVGFLSFSMNNALAELEYAEEKGLPQRNVIDLRQKYSKAKANLYNHPLVVEYHSYYKKVREITDYINRVLFKYIINEVTLCA